MFLTWFLWQHLDAGIQLLRARLMDNPEWFRSDRIAFVDTLFGNYWTSKYNEFKLLESLPALSYDYYKGDLPEPRPSQKIWGVDIDELYIPFNMKGDHWVALFISLPKRHITIYDSLSHHVKPEELWEQIEHVAVMFPYLMRTLSDEERKYEWTLEPFTYDKPIDKVKVPQQNNGNDCGMYTLKYIECHALGMEFPQTLCGSNIPDMRYKLGADIFHELGFRAPKSRDWKELD